MAREMLQARKKSRIKVGNGMIRVARTATRLKARIELLWVIRGDALMPPPLPTVVGNDPDMVFFAGINTLETKQG
jgi:hypothetical protein